MYFNPIPIFVFLVLWIVWDIFVSIKGYIKNKKKVCKGKLVEIVPRPAVLKHELDILVFEIDGKRKSFKSFNHELINTAIVGDIGFITYKDIYIFDFKVIK